MIEPSANVSFSAFCREIMAIVEPMNAPDRRKFKRVVATYYIQKQEPNDGWKKLVSKLLSNSETQIYWSHSYLDDIRRGEGDTRRAIALYYYLHSLTDDLSYADAVDEIVFSDSPAGKRTYACVHGGKPVFQPPDKSTPPEDKSWKSALNQWAYERLENKAANSLFAQLSIERTQGGDTREPVALLAEVHIRPAYEHESGIELQFKSVDIVLGCAEGVPSNIVFAALHDETASERGYTFRLQGTASGPYVTLSDEKVGLDGTYVSGTVATFFPNCGQSELSATLLVRILTTNAIFPEDIPSIMKRQIIKRIAEKAMLPTPDRAGHILLHTLKYGIRSVER